MRRLRFWVTPNHPQLNGTRCNTRGIPSFSKPGGTPAPDIFGRVSEDSLRGAYVDGAVNLELGLVRQRLRGQDSIDMHSRKARWLWPLVCLVGCFWLRRVYGLAYFCWVFGCGGRLLDVNGLLWLRGVSELIVLMVYVKGVRLDACTTRVGTNIWDMLTCIRFCTRTVPNMWTLQ